MVSKTGESKIRRLLSRSLETEGFDVAVADSAMSASEFLKNGHCDLIILRLTAK